MRKVIYTITSLTLFVQFNSYASDAPWGAVSNEAIDQCRYIASNVDRLYCYDGLFKAAVNTNIQVEEVKEDKQTKPQEVISPFVSIIQDIENKRQIDPLLYLSHIQYGDNLVFEREGYNSALINQLGEVGYNVYLTKPAMDASATYKPVLAITCINDITSLQIVLPEAYGSIYSSEITISNNKGQKEKQRWRVLMDGQVLSAPRGLDSIRFIQGLFNEDFLRIQTTLKEHSVSATFDLKDLRVKISPLAKACHWAG